MLRRADSTVTIYPQWGSDARSTGAMETRRHRSARYAVNSTPAHDLLYTADAEVDSEFYGARSGGRLVLTVGEMREHTDEYNSRSDSVQDVEVRLYVDPSEHPEARDEM